MLLALVLACSDAPAPAPTAAAPAPTPPAAAPGPARPGPATPRGPAFGVAEPSPEVRAALVALRTAAPPVDSVGVNPGTGLVERFTFHAPADLHGAPAAMDWLLANHAGVFGGITAADLRKVNGDDHRVTYEQVHDGLPVDHGTVDLELHEGGRAQVRALLATGFPARRSELQPEAEAVAAAQAAVAADPEWSRRIVPASLTRADQVWWAPRLHFPEREAVPVPAWRVRPDRGPGHEVLVDATGKLLYVRDGLQPQGQLQSELASYLPAPGTDRPFAPTVYGLLELAPGTVVADVGAGSGALTWPLSEKVGPEGVVYANDIDDVAIDFLQRRLAADPPPHPNVRVVHAFNDDQRLPVATLDAALLCQVHFFLTPEQQSWAPSLKTLYDAMKPGGRLVVVEARANGDLAALRRPFETVGFRFDQEVAAPAAERDWVVRFLR